MKIIPIKLMPFNMVKSFAIKGEKTILIDTGVPDSAKKILKELHKHGIENNDISLIVLTHSHSDHSGSAKALKELLNIPIAIHKAEAKDLELGRKRPYLPTGFAGKLWKNSPPAKAEFDPVTPDIIIEHEMDLAPFGVDAKVIHTPGHTPGSVSVVVEDNLIIAGDLLAGGVMIGGVAMHSRPILPPFQEDIPATKKSIQKVLDLQPKALHVCHGGPLDVESVHRMIEKHNWDPK